MTPDEINREIAAILGVKAYDRHLWEDKDERRYFECQRCKAYIGWGDFSKEKGVFNDTCRGNDADFHGDLNACAQFEATLPEEQIKRLYVYHLASLMKPGEFTVMAPAPQRCEAFLRVHGKWKE